ncbi:hypothetical protein H4R18_004521 [Coemansia javaensis]|uniref:DNA replication regulator Sld3 C-terminal domain-containing protein n=1 Tax=Coemansia javaensis TaxID=2761396 RepID=A0A9W8H5X3_9FUNG|nr:hypothetical protein H4R18_004521 [Coemansia javaensis]
MSAMHVYFLFDVGALADCGLLVRVVTRLLAYLASEHDALTWNYEVTDLRTRQAAPGRRQVCERRPVSGDALQALERALEARRRDAASGGRTQRAALGALRERLMCLEADVEWGDPALMRSPGRAGTAGRAWADPTRLNESISVRSHLYVIGEPPGTPAEADAFVRGAAGEEGPPLLETLARLRDGIVGDGIWESYARKRVGVSWIRPSPQPRLREMHPVDVLVDAVFACCFEALGGCVLAAPALDCGRWLPFRALYAPLHRTRTHPGWSRKFAREISAVVDRLLLLLQQPATPTGRRSWSVQPGPAAPPGSLPPVLVEAAPARPRWLADARLLRRYNLPEMVALAGDAKAAAVADSGCGPAQLVCVRRAPLGAWPRVARALAAQPVYCRIEGDGALPRDELVLAEQQQPGDAYAAIVPVGPGALAALYPMDADAFSRASAALDLYSAAIASDDGSTSTSSELPPFSAAWLEPWAQQIDRRPLDVAPAGCSTVDVGIDESLVRDYMLSTAVAEDPPCVEPPEAAGSPPASPESPPKDDSCPAISTLEEWYSELYLKAVAAHARPLLDRAVAVLEPLLGEPGDDATLDSILRTSAAIECAFEDSDGAGGDVYAGMRRQRAAEAGADADGRRRWLLQECQLQILLHLLAIDRARQGGADSSGGARAEQLAEALYDLVDQLCIWASDEHGVSALGASSAADDEGAARAGDLAVAFIGSPAVGRFSETLGDIVDELRMQCGWVPPAAAAGGGPDDSQATAGGDDRDLPPEGRRRKGTPRKTSERSEVIVGQGRRKSHVVSRRRLARHMEELIGGSRGQQRRRSCANLPDTPALAAADGPQPPQAQPQRRRSAQLKLPPHLVRQLRNEVVTTARPASLARSHTVSGRGPSARPDSLGGRAASALGAAKPSAHRASSVCGRGAPKRQPIPEFGATGRCPSLSGGLGGMRIVSETPATKRRRTREAAAPRSSNDGGGDGSSPVPFVPSSLPAASTFIYDSDDSDVASPSLGRGAQHILQDAAALHGRPTARRALQFPGGGEC